MTHHEMGYIAKTAIPMFFLMVFMVVLLVIFPEMATYLPDNMRQVASG
jgi:TRAP-type mannitol/chloroaromatic compound transport system permease large subunit